MPLRIYWIAIAAMKMANTLETIIEPRLPNILFIGLISNKVKYVMATTMIIDIIVISNPAVSNDIMTVVIAPGPTRRGNAKGTTPVSSGIFLIISQSTVG